MIAGEPTYSYIKEAVGILVMALVTINGRDDRDPRRTL